MCLAIEQDPALSRAYTARNNTVAVVTDGTAVLGLGDIGPLAAMPVMEGKAVLFKHFGGVDAIPVCLESGSVDELVDAIARMAPSFGGINLEDISAPRCFDLERKLRERLDIPVFHDDQHGTAIVVLAGLINACRVVDRAIGSLSVVVSGAGAAGVAVTQLLQLAGVTDIVVCDSRGIIGKHRHDLVAHKEMLAATTNVTGKTGTIGDALKGADVYIGVSGGNVPEEQVAAMAPEPMIFALANPTPEVHPDIAHKYASIVATGRSDYPNQINNVLAFPGVFRGLLDAHAEDVSIEMLIRAADAIAAVVKDEEINPSYIIPSVFHPDVADTVAVAIAGEGKTSAGATGPIKVGSRSTAAPVDETGTLPRVR